MTLRPASALLTRLSIIHVTVLLLGSSWIFGGNISWARLGLSVWASLSLPITLAALASTTDWTPSAKRRLLWLLPPALYALLVVASVFNPSFQQVRFGEATLMIPRPETHSWLPSTATPSASLISLWFGAGAYLSAFNVALLVKKRDTLRALLIMIVVSTLALSVFGTLQKLAGADLYFGAVESSNDRFFATFIYNNHWGAFMILALAVALGLLFHQLSRFRGRGLWQSPFSAALVGVILIAIAAPMSASRAATAMASFLVGVAVLHALVRILASRRAERRSPWPAVLAFGLCIATTSTAIGWLALDPIRARLADTRTNLQSDEGLIGGRIRLYSDSWRLVEQKPVFGWGLDSYDVAFQFIRPRSVRPERQYERSYANTHNDWLQAAVETGFVGFSLLALTIIIPLASIKRDAARHPIVGYGLLGLATVLLYAFVEFPFANAAFVILFWTLLFACVRYADLIAPPSDT